MQGQTLLFLLTSLAARTGLFYSYQKMPLMPPEVKMENWTSFDLKIPIHSHLMTMLLVKKLHLYSLFAPHLIIDHI